MSTAFQDKCLYAFRNMKQRAGHTAIIINRNGVVGCLVNGRDWYSINAIMDPVNRYIEASRSYYSGTGGDYAA
jgi:hypothetical protein